MEHSTKCIYRHDIFVMKENVISSQNNWISVTGMMNTVVMKKIVFEEEN